MNKNSVMQKSRFCVIDNWPIKEPSRFKKYLVDTSAKIIFEAGLYAGNLASNDVKKEDMYIAVPTGLAIHFVLGRTFGRYQDYLRKVFGIKPALGKY